MKQLLLEIKYQDGEQVGIYVGMVVSLDYHPSIRNVKIVDTAFNEAEFENVISVTIMHSETPYHKYLDIEHASA